MKKRTYALLGIPAYLLCAGPGIVASALSVAKGFQMFLWVIGWTGGLVYCLIRDWLKNKVEDDE